MEKDTFTDPRDGKTYRTVKIGEQVWMAENLAFNAKGSKCYGEGAIVVKKFGEGGVPVATKTLSDKEIQKHCKKYGRLYKWKTAMKACPKGWHLPSNKEWEALLRFVGGDEIAGKKLKAKRGWSKSGNGTDEYGFSALPGGFQHPDNGFFFRAGLCGYWWSSYEFSDEDGDNACGQGMCQGDMVWYRYDEQSYLLSVRCIKDKQPRKTKKGEK